MGVRISRSLLARIEAEAAADPCREVCGLLFGTPDHVADAASIRNVAAQPDRAFELDPAALLGAFRAARRGGPVPVGCYHSHPVGPAAPSVTDAAAALEPGFLWLIVAHGGSALFRAAAGGMIHGAFDPVPMLLRE